MGKTKENNPNKTKEHISLCPKGSKTHCSAASRKRLRGSVICRSARGVTRLGFAADQWEVSFLRGSVARKRKWGCIAGNAWGVGGRLDAGILQQRLRYGHGSGESGQQTKCVSESVSMCARCVCPNLFICCTGGLSHCLEVLNCVPLGPTRRLVTHLKVSFSVVQHHLKD